MRFTEQNYPLLQFLKWTDKLTRHPEMIRWKASLDKDKYPRIPFLMTQPAEMKRRPNPDLPSTIRVLIYNNWPELQPAFASGIEIISRNFLLALDRSYDTFLNPTLFEEITGEHKGTLIMPSGEAILYDFEMRSPHTDSEGLLRYGISGNAIRLGPDGNTLSLAVLEDKAYDAEDADFIDRNNEQAQGLFDFVLVFKLFRKYAEVQTVEAKSIRRPTADQPDVKTTLDGIRFLDASWYTTIIRKEGFGVRGHFRLQPCGTNRSEKKLIYIHEFRKHGYVRRAKLLSEND